VNSRPTVSSSVVEEVDEPAEWGDAGSGYSGDRLEKLGVNAMGLAPAER
jgi:hypothetical protein